MSFASTISRSWQLETGRIAGIEALVRWQHPQRGLLLPAAFLDVADESGLIVPLSWWVLREACHQVRTWQQESRVRIAVG